MRMTDGLGVVAAPGGGRKISPAGGRARMPKLSVRARATAGPWRPRSLRRPVTGSLPRYIDHRYIALMGDALREPTFLILAALAPQPLHGYAIIGEVAALSGGRLELRPGTLYGALDRLAAEGLLEADREEVI